MTITELQFFMEKLEQMIYHNDNLMIYKHPSILSQIPQIQLLYQELSSMIPTLFLDNENNLHELEQVKNLRKRFKDAAEEARYLIDLFVFAINNNLGNERLPGRSDLIPNSLNLEEVMRSIMSIKVEFLSIITDDMKIHKSPCINNLEKQADVTYSNRNSMGKKKVLEEVVVGFDRDAAFIRDKLVEDHKQLDVVSIVGMGGLGKTTLATKVFNDPFVVYHFHIRGWVTVSQTYKKSDLLIQILTSMGVQCAGIKLDAVSSSYSQPADTFIGIKQEPTSDLYSQVRGMLHKSLKFKRYLIVIDDIWSKKAWDDLKLNFPNDNTGSRILLTSRLIEVASHAKPHGCVYHLPYLTEEESWVLLRKKVFHCDDCPDWLIEPGMQIAKNCHGLPLAVVVIAGVLAKRATSKYWWNRIAKSVGAFIVCDPNRHIKTLALSFEDLPSHLRDCFLYLGGFPEDYKFRVRKLMWLWIAEGLVIQEAKSRSLEEIAQDYVRELVDRNLLVVTDRKSNGSIKACSLHDLLRELCLEKATKEHFWLKIHASMSHLTWKTRDKPHRIFTNKEFFSKSLIGHISPRVQSLLCFDTSSRDFNKTPVDFRSYPLLSVLDIQNCSLKDFPQAIKLLVHLRYLAFWCTSCFPSTIFNLWSLQTLITKCPGPLWLPNTISNLVNLRHLRSTTAIYFPSIETPMNLQTISNVALVDGAESWAKCIPGIKKLTCSTWAYDDHNFQSLTSLETLKCTTEGLERESGQPEYPNGEFQKIHIRLPASLKKLSLVGCCLPWCDMSVIQSLPNLEVLNILDGAFLGHRWETGKDQFRQLKFLKLQDLNVRRWEASSINFPCLKRLILERCKDLEEIPLELGDIPTLELIEVDKSMCCVVESLNRIQEEQHNLGNYELNINVRNTTGKVF